MPMKIVSGQLVYICSHGEMHPLSEKDMNVLEEFFTLADMDEDEVEEIVERASGDVLSESLIREWDNEYNERWDDV